MMTLRIVYMDGEEARETCLGFTADPARGLLVLRNGPDRPAVFIPLSNIRRFGAEA